MTPLPRRRPIKLAGETISLDHLSDGRLVLGVGIGSRPWEWDYLGEETDLRTRGAMLDEGLDLLTRLWTGEPVLHQGRFYTYRGDCGPGRPELNSTPCLPRPRQWPRIPIWVAGIWPNKPPFRRAARWDGVVPLGQNGRLPPHEVQEIVAFINNYRTDEAAFDVVVSGHTNDAADREVVQAYVETGATWWLEDISPWAFGWNWQGAWPFEAMHGRIRSGPPKMRYRGPG